MRWIGWTQNVYEEDFPGSAVDKNLFKKLQQHLVLNLLNLFTDDSSEDMFVCLIFPYLCILLSTAFDNVHDQETLWSAKSVRIKFSVG